MLCLLCVVVVVCLFMLFPAVFVVISLMSDMIDGFTWFGETTVADWIQTTSLLIPISGLFSHFTLS